MGNLQWRIKDPVAGTNFVTRYAIQEFKQDPQYPGILYNHDNEFLHYQDDWCATGAHAPAHAPAPRQPTRQPRASHAPDAAVTTTPPLRQVHPWAAGERICCGVLSGE